MQLTDLIALYLSTFGVASFSVLLFLTYRSRQHLSRMRYFNSLALSGISVVWFVAGIVDAVEYLEQSFETPFVRTFFTISALLFPPLINQAFYAEVRDHLSRRWPWKIAMGASWAFTAFCVVWVTRIVMGWIDSTASTISWLFQAHFSLTAIFCLLLLQARKTGEEDPSGPQASYRKNIAYLLAALLALPLLFFFPVMREWGYIAARMMPLTFVFVGLYHQQRYEFFDLVVKRGLFFFVVFGVLLAFFAVAPALIAESGPDAPLVMTVIALPIVLSIPAAHRAFGRWLDRIWFGRLFDTSEASRLFLDGLRDVTSESGLEAQSERMLREIFKAEARVETHAASQGEREVGLIRSGEYQKITALEVPIQAKGQRYGMIHMGGRASQMPYFHADQETLQAIAWILARMIENLRLQEKRKDLELHASRSELKALRAQINPHFLFNALNAIASLIPKRPEQAEETVEQLAEVFRYTLRRSEQEWVRLEDEFGFIRAYLEVEQARFGERLEAMVELEDSVREARVPGMMVQTLVENAVKHGLSNVRGRGRLGLTGRLAGDSRLLLEVRDNGPGFELREGPDRDSGPKRGEGFGLKSIRRRLEGHFGSQAELRVEREGDVTAVQIEMPLRFEEGQSEAKAG